MVSSVESALECLKLWIGKLLVVLDGSHPEGERVGKELASTSRAGALDEWSGSEVLETRAWRGHVLSATVSALGGVSEERVTHPHGVVAAWALWNRSGLRVNSDHVRWSLADVAAGDVWSDGSSVDGHRWDSSRRGQPVALAVSLTVSAHVVVVADTGWESAELLAARTGGAEVLSVVVVVADGVEEGVTAPEGNGTGWAAWLGGGLGVSSEDGANGLGASSLAFWTWVTVEAVWAWGTSEAWETGWTLLAALAGWTRWTGWAGDTWDASWAWWTVWTVDTGWTTLAAWTWWTGLAVWTWLAAHVLLWSRHAWGTGWTGWTHVAGWTWWTVLAWWTGWTALAAHAWWTWLAGLTA